MEHKTFYNEKNIGDKKAADSVLAHIKSNQSFHGITFHIGAGVDGAVAFGQKSEDAKIKRVLIAWQWLDALNNIQPDVILAVPEHALATDAEKFNKIQDTGVQIIQTIGVPHDKKFVGAKDFNGDKPDYVVMLAGDTQGADGAYQVYDNDMLQGFLKQLHQLCADKQVVVLNGPRTGKYNKTDSGELVENMSAHTEGNMDDITGGVDAYIKKANLNSLWSIIDFKKGVPSKWDNALQYCAQNGVPLVLPGESTSMISEALGVGIRPIIYKHPVMTQSSNIFMDLLVQSGKAFDYAEMKKNMTYSFGQDPVKNPTESIVSQLEKSITSKKRFAEQLDSEKQESHRAKMA